MLEFNVVIGGVGGQGVMFLSKLITETAVSQGLNATLNQQKGLAQRGGSVKAFVRIGDVKTSLIEEGAADIALTLELAEAMKILKYLSEDSVVIINDQKVTPINVHLGIEKYPSKEMVLEAVKRYTHKAYVINALNLAEKINFPLGVNTIMLGAFAAKQKILRKENFIETISRNLKKYKNKNIKAFELGYNEMMNQ